MRAVEFEEIAFVLTSEQNQVDAIVDVIRRVEIESRTNAVSRSH